jgi:hypothetical protein
MSIFDGGGVQHELHQRPAASETQVCGSRRADDEDPRSSIDVLRQISLLYILCYNNTVQLPSMSLSPSYSKSDLAQP